MNAPRGRIGAAIAIAMLSTLFVEAQVPETPPFSTNDDANAHAEKPKAEPRKDAVQRLLEATGSVADVSLAVATFPLAAPAAGPTPVLVGIEVGRRQILPDSLSIGFRAFDVRGGVSFNGATEAVVAPATPDAASPLHYVAEMMLPAGRYRLRVAVVDAGGRAAALDHAFLVPASPAPDAGLAGALMIGPAPTGGVLRPLARAEIVRVGAIAWTDVSVSAAPGGRIEVRGTPGGPVLASAAATLDASGGHRLVRAPLPVAMLPPGQYSARLSMDVAGGALTRERPFTLGRLPPPDASALGDSTAAAVDPFSVAEVLAPAVVGPVLVRALEVDPSGSDDAMRAAVRAAGVHGVSGMNVKPFAKRRDLPALMLRGAALLDQGKLEDAANSFRDALRVSSEFFPAIVYLGACYAAGGRDREAVGAWQTALVSETDTPLVFRLAADGLLRLGDSAQAVTLLSEAAERWPGETTLARRHALALAEREGPAKALDALLPSLEEAQAVDPAMVSLAAQLAVASAARDDSGAAARVTRVAAIAARAGVSQPLLSRWNDYLEARK